MTDDLLTAAVDMTPEAWHHDIADDAATQRCTVVYRPARTVCAPRPSNASRSTSPPATTNPPGRRFRRTNVSTSASRRTTASARGNSSMSWASSPSTSTCRTHPG